MNSCINFNNNGDATGSVIEDNSFQSPVSRIITLSAVSNIKINNNIGYNVKGHGIVLETGAEIANYITNNLIIGLSSNPSLASDTYPAGIWVSNPQNYITGNAISGSAADGIVYSLRPTSVDEGYSRQICPEGSPLWLSSDNLIHSNARYGLYIENYAPRKNPCLETGPKN